MAITFLKKAVVASVEPKTDVISVLRKTLGGYKPERPHDVLHASDITKDDFCARQFALMRQLDVKKKARYISPALQATFDVGNATGELVRERWLGESSVGHWRCRKCNTVQSFTRRPSSGPCKSYGTCDWSYDEVNFVCKNTLISGSIDVLVDLKTPQYIVTELKIMKPEDFEKLAAPLAEHRIRTNLYLNLVENSLSPYRTSVNTQLAKILYVSRAYGKKNVEHGEVLPFKEFDIKRDDAVLTPYLNKAKMVKLHQDIGAMPPGICSTSMDKAAKACSVCKQCFSGDYPVTQGV